MRPTMYVVISASQLQRFMPSLECNGSKWDFAWVANSAENNTFERLLLLLCFIQGKAADIAKSQQHPPK